jgi:hypothetical protein
MSLGVRLGMRQSACLHQVLIVVCGKLKISNIN